MNEKLYSIEALKNMHVVEIMEMDRYSYPKIDETKLFDSESEARAFCSSYNSQNTDAVAPDWYMVALYKGKVLASR